MCPSGATHSIRPVLTLHGATASRRLQGSAQHIWEFLCFHSSARHWMRGNTLEGSLLDTHTPIHTSCVWSPCVMAVHVLYLQVTSLVYPHWSLLSLRWQLCHAGLQTLLDHLASNMCCRARKPWDRALLASCLPTLHFAPPHLPLQVCHLSGNTAQTAERDFLY